MKPVTAAIAFLILVGVTACVSAAPPLAQSIQAATDAANNPRGYCKIIRPFYWEIGDATSAQASGSVGDATYTATTTLDIASSSKWLYAAYVAQKRPLSQVDFDALHMTTGYISFGGCSQGQTVGQCAAFSDNDLLTPSAVGKFYYSGGPMQMHAVSLGMGAMDKIALGAAMSSTLGVPVTYNRTQIEAGAIMTPQSYAVFLRKLMSGALQLIPHLGTNAVCTQPQSCPSALYSPVPDAQVGWMYSVGHWIEPNGAFSSTGGLGFYPWITPDRTLYGIVARQGPPGSGWASSVCGAEIRKAWIMGVASIGSAVRSRT